MIQNTIRWESLREPRDQGRQEVMRSARELLRRSNQEVPVDTGLLRNSGKVVPGESGGTASVVYDAPYAVAVHQRTWVRHPVGRAKWLELAAIEYEREFERNVSQAVVRTL